MKIFEMLKIAPINNWALVKEKYEEAMVEAKSLVGTVQSFNVQFLIVEPLERTYASEVSNKDHFLKCYQEAYGVKPLSPLQQAILNTELAVADLKARGEAVLADTTSPSFEKWQNFITYVSRMPANLHSLKEYLTSNAVLIIGLHSLSADEAKSILAAQQDGIMLPYVLSVANDREFIISYAYYNHFLEDGSDFSDYLRYLLLQLTGRPVQPVVVEGLDPIIRQLFTRDERVPAAEATTVAAPLLGTSAALFQSVSAEEESNADILMLLNQSTL